MQKPPENKKYWFTRSQMANLFKISAQAFDANIRKHLPPEFEKREGRRVLLYGPGVIDVALRRRSENGSSRAASDDNSEVELRRIKVEQARVELDQRLGHLVEIDQLRDGLTQITTVLRRAADKLQKRHGAAAFEVFNDALNEAESAIQKRFLQDGENGRE